MRWSDPRFYFAVPVWGQRYVDMFLNVGLPSQLAAANLPGFPPKWLQNSCYTVYTTSADAEQIEAHPLWRELQLIMGETRIWYIDEQMVENDKWPVLRYCHRQQVMMADARHAATYFLCPDQLWSNGSLLRAAHLIVQGHTAVMCAGPRAIEEEVLPLLQHFKAPGDSGVLEIPSRDLMRLLYEHQHPETECWHWDSGNYFGCGTYIYFDVPGGGMVSFCYVLHPVVVRPEVRGAPFKRIFDQDWLAAACPHKDRIYVVQDSDVVSHIELSPGGMQLPSQPNMQHLDPIEMMTWYATGPYNAHHRHFATFPVLLHYEAKTSSREWEMQVQRGLTIVAAIEIGLSLPDDMLLALYPENLLRRLDSPYRERTAIDSMLVDSARELIAERRHRPPWVAPVWPKQET